MTQTNASQFGRQAFAVAAQPLPQIEPPAIVHPAMAGRFAEGQEPAGIPTAARWLGAARDALQQINTLRANPDPSNTENAHVLAVADRSAKVLDGLNRGYDEARKALQTAEAGYQAEIDQRARLTPTAHAAEIRSVVRGLPDESARYAAVIGAMQSGDAATVAAVLSAPGITSGLTDDQISNLRQMHTRRQAPEQLAALEAVKKAQRSVVSAFDWMLGERDALTLEPRAKALREQQRQAREASQSRNPWEAI